MAVTASVIVITTTVPLSTTKHAVVAGLKKSLILLND